MYRLLIVDDEPQIVDWLYELMSDYTGLDLELYKAYTALEAVEIVDRMKPDIVLTDIRMPGMTGIQLQEYVLQRWPDCKIIFLTGFNEFDYIYSAMKRNAVGYVLKTEDDDEIIRTIEKAALQISESYRIDELMEKVRDKMQATLPLMQKEYVWSLLQEEQNDPARIGKQLQELDIPLDAAQPVLLLIARTDGKDKASGLSERSRTLCSIGLILEKYLQGSVRFYYLVQDHHTIIGFIQPGDMGGSDKAGDELYLWSRTFQFVKSTLESVQMACKENLGAAPSFLLASRPVALERLAGKYGEWSKWLGYQMMMGTEILMTDRDLYPDESQSHGFAPHPLAVEMEMAQHQIKVLSEWLEKGQGELFFEAYDQFQSRFRRIADMNDETGVELYYKTAVLFLAYLNRRHLAERVAPLIDLQNLTRMDRHPGWQEAAAYLRRLAEIIFELQKGETEQRVAEAVLYVKKYLLQHLHEDLSLTRLAELVHFNPSYFSRMFKQVTGLNLSEYLSGVRLEKAKALLECNKKVNEVAAIVGFESAASFSRFFKKMVDISPQDYRESCLKR
ncbi:response regulator transcription factor [Cohnella silvisoli]|uniref:Response regulator n=1 Tax=Cohnella silvisoli TaxID=2873699 RepID=A0ABV1KLS8_9BACL|nr:response regulator [Cohnella silvisoli]MCD9020609.1 response regulator [Cohnella silvisoli]